MVGELPDGVGEGGPECHLGQGVVLWRGGSGGENCVEGRKADGSKRWVDAMHYAVKGDARHDMDE